MLQIAITRLLSLALWHHFAFLVVGLALLGFGLAGSWQACRSLRRDDDGVFRRQQQRLAIAAAVVGQIAILVALLLRPNALLLFRDSSVAFSLACMVVLLAVPFVAIGLVIVRALTRWAEQAPSIYAADLCGGGLAAVLGVLAISHLGALGLCWLAGMFLVAAGFLFGGPPGRRLQPLLMSCLALIVGGLPLLQPDAWVRVAPTKELAFYHRNDSEVPWIEHRAWTPHGRIDVGREIDAPPLVAGEVANNKRFWRIHFVTQDGAAPTTIHRVEKDPSELTFLKHSSTAAVWHLRGAKFGGSKSKTDALVIGVGGGVDIQLALAFGAARVTGVDINPALLHLLRDRYADFSGNLAARSDVRLVQSEGRAFVRATPRKFGVIQLAGVDTFTALASGAYSLAEAHVYTLEAFEDYLDHLAPGGCLSISRLILDPPRETLRLAVSAAQAMRQRGEKQPHRRIAIVRGKLWATMLTCQRPIAPAQMSRLRDFATANGFRLTFDPYTTKDGVFAQALASKESAAELVANYRYSIKPAVDERPFFFDFFRWSQLSEILHLDTSSVYSTRVPVGHGIQLLTLLLSGLLAGFGIAWPLRKRASDIPGRGVGIFFFLLGVAFLFAEVAFIQRLTFLLGHPTFGLVVAFGGLLLASGLGAAVSRHWLKGFTGKRSLHFAALCLGLAAGVSLFLIPYALALPFAARLAIGLALVFAAGFAMGVPFPWAIRRLHLSQRQDVIPWAFAVNSFATVAAAAAAPLLALELGFSALLLTSAVLYLAASRFAARLS